MSIPGSYDIVPVYSMDDFYRHQSSLEDRWWFRGHRNMDYSLLPALYRKVNTLCEVKLTEDYLYNDFCARNFHLIDSKASPGSKMEWLCLMQHYGLPTRLLDWTENAINAFIFALEPYFISNENIRTPDLGELDYTTKIPCIWAIKPDFLNEIHGLERIKNIVMIEENKLSFSEEYGETLKSIFFTGISACCNIVHHPLPVLHPYNNLRIRAQLGAFTLFPLYADSCEAFRLEKKNYNCFIQSRRDRGDFKKYALENICGSNWLIKYIIVRPFNVHRELAKIGIKRSMIYPEMPVVSSEIEHDVMK